MLINKLLLPVGVQHHGEAVKALDYAVQLEAVHKEHCNRGLVLPQLVKETILEILRFLHFSQLLFPGAGLFITAPS